MADWARRGTPADRSAGDPCPSIAEYKYSIYSILSQMFHTLEQVGSRAISAVVWAFRR
jgi:hypothetical protein